MRTQITQLTVGELFTRAYRLGREVEYEELGAQEHMILQLAYYLTNALVQMYSDSKEELPPPEWLHEVLTSKDISIEEDSTNIYGLFLRQPVPKGEPWGIEFTIPKVPKGEGSEMAWELNMKNLGYDEGR
jgi:hypothetical protein